MSVASMHTTGDLADLFGVEPWQVRAAVDALGAARIPRLGRYRVLPDEMLPELREELLRRGWLEE